MQSQTNPRYTLSASGLLLGIENVVAPQQLSQSPRPDAPQLREISGLKRGRLSGRQATVAVACAAIVPLGVTVHSSAPLPSAVDRPITSNGAVSNSGARARTAKGFIFPPGIESRSRSNRHCWAKGPCTTRPG